MMSTNKRTLKYNRMAKQAGMTLIELTVVLLILVGLAGLLVPYVGSFTQKTHDSTNSSNLSALNSAFGRYVSEKNKLPDNLDTLTNTADLNGTETGGCAATRDGVTSNQYDAYCGLLDPSMFLPVTYSVTDGTGTSEDAIAVASLTKAGITAFYDNDPTAANKTFNSGKAGIEGLKQSDAFVAGTKLNLITVNGLTSAATQGALAAKGITVDGTPETHLALALGGHAADYSTTCYDYVALGIGDHNKMIGNTLQSAPVHFPEDAAMGPVDYYNHYIAIVQVDKNNSDGCSSTTEKAKFLGVVMNVPSYAGSYLYGVNQSLAYGYENGSNK